MKFSLEFYISANLVETTQNLYLMTRVLIATYQNILQRQSNEIGLNCVDLCEKFDNFDLPDTGGSPHDGGQDIQPVQVVCHPLRVHLQLQLQYGQRVSEIFPKLAAVSNSSFSFCFQMILLSIECTGHLTRME